MYILLWNAYRWRDCDHLRITLSGDESKCNWKNSAELCYKKKHKTIIQLWFHSWLRMKSFFIRYFQLRFRNYTTKATREKILFLFETLIFNRPKLKNRSLGYFGTMKYFIYLYLTSRYVFPISSLFGDRWIFWKNCQFIGTRSAIASVQWISQGIPTTIYNSVSAELGCMSAANYVQLPGTG